MILRTLPDPIPPARHEVLASYIGRLAARHGLDGHGLWVQISRLERPGSTRRLVIPARLTALTGRSVHALAGALPELRDPSPDWAMFRHQPQAGCQRCDARHPGGPVVRLLPHHRYVCLRHRTWIGPPDIDQPAVDLARLPELVDAQRRHLRILRRYGWEATYDAVLTALMLCAHIWSDGRLPDDVSGSWHTWNSRTHTLIPHDDVERSYSTSRLFAAVYPEAVALAALIVSPAWRRMASSTAAQSRFFAEVGKHVTYPYKEGVPSDAVAHWALVDSWRLPSRPLTTYAPGSTRGIVPGLHGNRLTRHEKSKMWFGRLDRNRGRTLLFHGHLKPVLARKWTPKYERWEGTIWHSTRIDDLMQTEVARHRERGEGAVVHLPKQRTSFAGASSVPPGQRPRA